MVKKNGCIFLISARKYLLERCLRYLDQNYNNQFNYPILVFYHGDKYDDEKFRNSIKNINRNTKITFHNIKAEIPSNLKSKDMFWNLPNNKYAKSFTNERLGYLHAVTWKINSIEDKHLSQYDYFMMIDDDSWFKNKIQIDFFNELDYNNKLCGSAYKWNYININVLETRTNLFQWIKDYVKKYNVNIKNQELKKIINEYENDNFEGIKYNKKFHSLNFLSGNCNIYSKRLFNSKDWKNYLSEFNKFAGGYRFRWTDCEIISMYYYLHIGDDFLDLDLINKNLYNNQIDNICYDINYKKINRKSLLCLLK